MVQLKRRMYVTGVLIVLYCTPLALHAGTDIMDAAMTADKMTAIGVLIMVIGFLLGMLAYIVRVIMKRIDALFDEMLACIKENTKQMGESNEVMKQMTQATHNLCKLQ